MLQKGPVPTADPAVYIAGFRGAIAALKRFRLLRRTVYQRYIPCVFCIPESHRALFKSGQSYSKSWNMGDTRPDMAGGNKRILRVARGLTVGLTERAPGEADTLVAILDRSLGQVRRRNRHAAERTMGKAPNVFAAGRRASMCPSGSCRALRSVFFIAGTLWHRSALLQLPPILATRLFDRFRRQYATSACSVINGFITWPMKTTAANHRTIPQLF